MPLSTIRVLDLTRLLPGPFATMIFADFGAEVIKIEDPDIGDYARYYEPKVDEYSTIFHSLNRNKKSVCLNLKDPEGKEQFLALAKTADVIVESFRPGVMDRLGLGYETLKIINPKLIYCAITGYGQTGPYADEPGHDLNYISFAGLLNMNGESGGRPVIPAVQIADIGGGAYPALVGILMALFERERSGKGQFVDISMLDGVISLLQTTLPTFFMKGEEVRRGEHMLTGALAGYSVYETKDGRWISVAALEPKFWQAFCQTIGKPEWIPLWNASEKEQERMRQEIQERMATKTLAEWMGLFHGVEACVSPVLTFKEMVEHPQVKAREMVQTINGEHTRPFRQIGIPIKLSKTPGKIRSCAPKLGAHTEEVLGKNF